MPTSGVEWLRHGDEANFDNEVVRTIDAIVNMLDCQNAAEIAELAIHYKKPLIVSDSILNSSCLAVYRNAAKHVPVLQCSSSHLKIAADSMREIARLVEELAHEKPDGKIHELQKS